MQHKRGANGKGMLGSNAFAGKLRELGYDIYAALPEGRGRSRFGNTRLWRTN